MRRRRVRCPPHRRMVQLQPGHQLQIPQFGRGGRSVWKVSRGWIECRFRLRRNVANLLSRGRDLQLWLHILRMVSKVIMFQERHFNTIHQRYLLDEILCPFWLQIMMPWMWPCGGVSCVCMYLCNEDVICNFRRDKTFNFFSVMLKKRLKNEEDDSLDAEEGETSATKSKGRLRKDLVSSL